MKKETVYQVTIILLLFFVFFWALVFICEIDVKAKNTETAIDSCNLKIQLLAREVIEIKGFQAKIAIEKPKPIIIVKKEFIKPCVPLKEVWYIRYKVCKEDKYEIWNVYDSEEGAQYSMKLLFDPKRVYSCEIIKTHMHLK
jgi:hypothetical protein